MATTIVTKSGSGAPTASNLVAGELAVDLTNKRLYTENSSGTVLELGTNPASDVTFGDNTKAVFGDGSDLRIYHTGSHSTIENIGTGHLQIHTTDFRLKDSAGTESMILANADGNVQLYYNNAEKLATTATGIDVTGSVLADGLTVDDTSGTVGLFNSTAVASTLAINNTHANAWGSNIAFRTGGTDAGYFGSIGSLLGNTDQDLSVYSTAGNGFRIYTNGNNERLRVTSAGNVGIGTSSPNAVADLHVADTSDARIWLDATSADTMELYSGTGVGMFNRSNSYLMLGTNNTERMRIDASGNAGIGTSSPVNYGSGSQGLTINGTGNYQNLNLQVGGTTQFTIYTNGVSGTFINQVTADPMMFYTSDTERMRITSGGALEIGPAANKVIIKSQGSFQNTTLESHIINADGTGAYGSGDVLIQPRCSSVSSNNIVFGTSGGTNTTTERMRIDASGNLLVGSTTASAKLFVEKAESGNSFGARNTSASNIGTVGFFGADRNTTNGTFHYIDCYNYGSSTYRFRVADSGNATNTNNSYGALSDVKLKENIIDSGSQWDDIKALRVRKYSLKSDSLDAPNKLGVIAQELESVGMAGLVSESEDRDEEGNNLGTVTKTVAYSVLYMKAVKALQEAMERIETLEAKVAALES
jgi:hypothetical protein